MKRLMALLATALTLFTGVGRADFVEVNPSTLTVDAAIVVDGVIAIRYVWQPDGSTRTYSVVAFRTIAGETEVHTLSCVPGELCSSEAKTVPGSTLTMTDSEAQVSFESSVLGTIELTWIPGTTRHVFGLDNHGCSYGPGGSEAPRYNAFGFDQTSSFAFSEITGSLGEPSFDSVFCGAYLHRMLVAYDGGLKVG